MKTTKSIIYHSQLTRAKSVEGFRYNKALGLPLYLLGDLVTRYDDKQLYLVDRVLDKDSAKESLFIKNIEDS